MLLVNLIERCHIDTSSQAFTADTSCCFAGEVQALQRLVATGFAKSQMGAVESQERTFSKIWSQNGGIEKQAAAVRGLP